jgi:hypothetical protein
MQDLHAGVPSQIGIGSTKYGGGDKYVDKGMDLEPCLYGGYNHRIYKFQQTPKGEFHRLHPETSQTKY